MWARKDSVGGTAPFTTYHLALPQTTSSTHNMGADDSKRLTNQATPTRLLDLPPEAILCIADFLPAHSAASLAFCNHSLSQVLGPQCWKPLRQHNHEARIAFLSALAKDLPGYFVCHICSLLHLSSRVLPPRPTESGLFQNSLRCVRNDASLSHRMPRSPYILKFAHVQLAMKRRHYGLDHGISLDSLSHTEVEERNFKEYCSTTLLSVDARIASEELLMRSQQCIILPTDKRDKFLSPILPVQTLCRHIWDGQEDDRLRELIKCSLDHLGDKRTCSTCMGTLQCQYCYMDFEIDIRDLGMRGTALVVTRWINLGAGLTPHDKKWRSHHVVDDSPVPFCPGSIRSSFKDQKGSSVNELAAENIKKLFSNRTHAQGRCGPDGYTWVLYREELWYIAPCGKGEARARSPPLSCSNVTPFGTSLLNLFLKYFWGKARV